ncbi:hypothetical protein BY458DRAFT_542917 [Sporodiniella umbellata]|nr:hypothetical protein BY458DRAFT_542917 [Sporodiniella umbellata]
MGDYTKPSGIRSKLESFTPQRPSMSSGLDPLPGPSNSSLLPRHDSTSLLPLPPPLTGSTPTKRRSKVPNADRRNTDIEFATEIGQGLLLEVRKMQALLQEKEEKLRTLENQKADLERAAEAMAKQMRQTEENEEKLKEDTWNLELAKQELKISVTELQQNLNKANAEQNKLSKQVNTLRSEIEQLRDKEEKLNSTIETMKARHEQDMTSIRRHTAVLQREKTDQTKKIEALTSELAIAKAQSRIVKHSAPETEPSKPTQSENPTLDESLSQKEIQNEPSASLSEQLPKRNQAMEVETLKTTLAHAHRMVSNLRSNLHKEKTEKFELKKLLAESQETIEQLQNDPRLWVDARPVRSSSSNLNSSKDDSSRRFHKASAKRRGRKSSNAATKRGKPKNTSQLLFAENESTSSYSSLSENSEDESEVDINDSLSNKETIGFTTLSSELSQSQVAGQLKSIDAQINTDPVHIRELLLTDKESQSSNIVHTSEGTNNGGSATCAAISQFSVKQGATISTQTEVNYEGVECFVQTDDTLCSSLSTQTDESRVIEAFSSNVSVQTEAKPNGIENCVQTLGILSKPTIETSTQTDPKPKGTEILVQTNRAPVESLSTQTDTSQFLENSTQTDAEMLVQTDESVSDKNLTGLSYFGQQHRATGEDSGIQTSSIEVKDAQVQSEMGSILGSSEISTYLSSSPSNYRPFTDDEDTDSCYYDANSEVFHSKPSSRHTISSLATYNEPSPRHSWKSAMEEPVLRKSVTPRVSRTESLLTLKPSHVHTFSDRKHTSNSGTENVILPKEKMFSKEETDDLIATAVAVALAKAKENNYEGIHTDIDDSGEENDFGNVLVHMPNNEDDQSNTASPYLANGPFIAYEQEPEETEWTEKNVPQRPSNPPPMELLSKAVSSCKTTTLKTNDGDHLLSVHKNNNSASSLSSANTNEHVHNDSSLQLDSRITSDFDRNAISLITKTMIGDWMWKYTRKPVSGGISENRHQRYFWIHPYTRTLYWSNKAPGIDPSQTKAKSALIESIAAVPDFSTSPDDLPNVSLLIQTSHRQLKLTAPSMEKHEDWLESISHLVNRNSQSSLRLPNDRNMSSNEAHSSLTQKQSLHQLHEMFHQPSSSTSITTDAHTSDYENEGDDPLEDVRMCCNGKHHVSKLERDRAHRHHYRKHLSRVPKNH